MNIQRVGYWRLPQNINPKNYFDIDVYYELYIYKQFYFSYKYFTFGIEYLADEKMPHGPPKYLFQFNKYENYYRLRFFHITLAMRIGKKKIINANFHSK